ncbi:SCO family protein [Burkholderia guangdongensis]|uniref:SCO family protein n=1 Tax=Burkholderia guangdongensis TaxID=1792500 RepID=UPI0015CE2FE6|nr:cytochrome C oxidase subunit I [Burkholderia guangdongensis]
MQSSRQPARRPIAGADAPARGSWQRGRWMLLLVALVCAAPMIASYVTYYVIKPRGGSTNYGALIDPQRPIPPSLTVVDESGKTVPLASLRGVWLFVMTDKSACDDACATKLYFMRQVRATQAGERERITTVWLRSDANPIPDKVSAAYPDTRKLVADPAAIAAWLPADAGTQDTDHIYLVDPNGNLMMRFPKNPDPSKIKRDVTKLLKWSSIG